MLACLLNSKNWWSFHLSQKKDNFFSLKIPIHFFKFFKNSALGEETIIFFVATFVGIPSFPLLKEYTIETEILDDDCLVRRVAKGWFELLGDPNQSQNQKLF